MGEKIIESLLSETKKDITGCPTLMNQPCVKISHIDLIQ